MTTEQAAAVAALDVAIAGLQAQRAAVLAGATRKILQNEQFYESEREPCGEFLETWQIAERLNAPEDTVRVWARRGKVRAIKSEGGGRWLVDLESARRWRDRDF